MKPNWKRVLLYIVKFVELLITGAAGGALGNNL
ncbi:unknown [Prevotella sp. CAG:924]|nr:unknown [Prevotella sp. CAG:924]